MNALVAEATMQQFQRNFGRSESLRGWVEDTAPASFFLLILSHFAKPGNSSHFRPSQDDCPWARSKKQAVKKVSVERAFHARRLHTLPMLRTAIRLGLGLVSLRLLRLPHLPGLPLSPPRTIRQWVQMLPLCLGADEAGTMTDMPSTPGKRPICLVACCQPSGNVAVMEPDVAEHVRREIPYPL